MINPKHTSKVSEQACFDQNIVSGPGENLGRFRLGSTVMMPSKRDTIAFNEDRVPELTARLGEFMGNGCPVHLPGRRRRFGSRSIVDQRALISTDDGQWSEGCCASGTPYVYSTKESGRTRRAVPRPTAT